MLEIAVYLVCIAACSVLSWYAMYQAIFSWETDAADQRAITVPLIYAYAPMFLGFFLMGIEFVRLLLSGDTIYGTSATERDVRVNAMPWYETMLILIGGIVALMMAGFPVPFAFLTVNCVAAYFLMGGTGGIIQVLANATASISTFTLVAIPMFLLMGELFFRTKMVLRVFDTLEMMLGRVPGRLSYLAVAGGTLFSALIGSSMANTAMLGSLLGAEMVRRGYKPHMAMGPIMGTGSLAMIIPPSGLAVLLGSLANIDIGGLLIGGFGPGLLLATMYALLIFATGEARSDLRAPAMTLELPAVHDDGVVLRRQRAADGAGDLLRRRA